DGPRLSRMANKFCEWLGELPEDVFPPAVYAHFEHRPRRALLLHAIGNLLPLDVAAALPAGDESDPAVALSRREQRSAVRAALVRLGPREQKILAMRFGLGGGERATYATTGDALGISGVRVRQIEMCALDRLRKPLAGTPR
ncbi:hypothetical protein LCGC14_2340380, partial [marine sediment metagenome]